MTYIARSLDEAKSALIEAGYTVDVVMNNMDRMPHYDTILVTNEVYDGSHVRLTAAPFLLEVEER